MKEIRPGKYRHFKGGLYEVIGSANHSETLEEYVVYRALYGDHALWVRPVNLFSDLKEINGQKVERFEFIEE